MSVSRSILIVEDDPLIADDLYFILQDVGIKDVDVALQYDKALRLLSEKTYDLALLDVNLSSEKDGVDLAEFINSNVKIPFIFITSYYDKDTLRRAKEMNPSAYILKPFDKYDIQVNVELSLHKLANSKASEIEKIFVKDKGKMISVDPQKIDFVEAFDNYSKVFLESQAHILSHTLKSIEAKLEPYSFVRVHKSYLVNFSRITMISDGFIYFGEHKIPIGRAYKAGFMSKISLL